MDKFWSKVKKTNKCWWWSAAKDGCNYGRLGNKKAHRVSYEMHFGKIPKGIYVCHSCDNPSCVNPEHLFLGTQKQNMLDMVRKGRQNKAKGSKHGNAKLTEEIVNKIRNDYKIIRSTRKLAKIYNISRSSIKFIVQYVSWRHI